MYEDGASPVMAMGISIEKIRLDEIVEKLFDKKLAGITWLTELNVGKKVFLLKPCRSQEGPLNKSLL